MSLEKNLRLGKLFDAYGALLSSTQFDIMTDFLSYDLTLSEVAENRNITRQAVSDVVSKATKKLEGYEKKLGFLDKLERLELEIKKLKGE